MDDLELIQKCINGDKASRDDFLACYSRLFYNYIHHVIRSKGFSSNQISVEDIFQDIFRALFEDNCKKLKSFKAKNDCTLATWLRQVVINFTIDYLRRQKQFISLDAENDDESPIGDLLEDDSKPADEVIALKEKLARLEQCIDKLDLDEKLFVELHFNQGVSLGSLKGLLSIARGAVDMQKQRLINKLRDCFKLKGFLLDF